MVKKHTLDVTEEQWKRVQLFKLLGDDGRPIANINEALILLIDAGLSAKKVPKIKLQA